MMSALSLGSSLGFAGEEIVKMAGQKIVNQKYSLLPNYSQLSAFRKYTSMGLRL